MLPYTLDDHFAFGYGSGLFNPDDKTTETPLWCTYSRCSRNPGTFREECVLTAKLLSERMQAMQREPALMLSGGMDSEVVVKAFIEAEVPFSVWTFRF